MNNRLLLWCYSLLMKIFWELKIIRTLVNYLWRDFCLPLYFHEYFYCCKIAGFLTPEIGSETVTERYFRTQIHPWNFKPSASHATASFIIESNFSIVTTTGWRKSHHQSCQILSPKTVLEFKSLAKMWLTAQPLDMHLQENWLWAIFF